MVQTRYPTPTEEAERFFNNGVTLAGRASREKNPELLAEAVSNISRGLQFLAVGVRATYRELEHVKELVGKERS
jgi:hypothetical protein